MKSKFQDLIKQHIYHFTSITFRIGKLIFIVFYKFIEFIILLYNSFVISFSRYKEYMICMISFSKFSDVSTGFTFAIAIGNL